MITLGVISDTHVPDRASQLDPEILRIFRQAQVKAILHAGDVIVPQVIQQLEQVAAVQAVRGNRDIFYLRKLPAQIELNYEGFSVGLAHGHNSFQRYMVDKIHRAMHGWSAERYVRRMLKLFPQADVIVFGHLHIAYNLVIEGKLVFNPGSTSFPWPRGSPATIGLLHLERGRQPIGEIIELAGK